MSDPPSGSPRKLSPAMLRLPPSPDMNPLLDRTLIPDFSLDDETIPHRSNLSNRVSIGGTTNATAHFEHAQYHQHRLRSVAKYSAFHPQALACSNDVVVSSYKDQFESASEWNGPSSLGAIAGPRGVALFQLSRPHVPLLIFSHATNFSSSVRKNQKVGNSISSLAFQPLRRDNECALHSNSLYLAAARGSGVLIWDASGHSPNPLLGRLMNDATNDTGNSSNLNGRRDFDSRITSMSWMPYGGGTSSSPMLATTTASSLSMWDLRCHLTTGLFQPSLRFGSSRNSNRAATSSSLTPVAPIVQVACSSFSAECATIDASGIVRTYDLRKTEMGNGSPLGSPLSVFVAHDAGVGISHLPRTKNGSTESAWVTWGLETPVSSAVVKVWGSARSITQSELPVSNPSGFPTMINDEDKEDYWFMGDESHHSTLAKDTRSNEQNSGERSSDHHLIAQYAQSNICCARVCPSPISNCLVVVGYLGDSSSLPGNTTKDEKGGWWVELMKLSSTTDTFNSIGTEFGKPRKENFGLDRIMSFSGGTASVDTLNSALGNTKIGMLQAAELSLSSSISLRKSTGATIGDDNNRVATDDVRMELLLCCLSDTGVLTTIAMPEALPYSQTSDVQKKDVPPQRSSNHSKMIRTAFTPINKHARVFPETSEGSSFIDIASVWGTHEAGNLASRFRGDERPDQSRSSSPQKVTGNSEDFLINNGRRVEGNFMPFDMEVPIAVAYNSVATGNLGAIQIGMTEMAPLSAIINTTTNGTEPKRLYSASIMENIDKERVPCPRLCGAVFGPGNGRLAIFRNGDVKKMWNWYQRTDTSRLSGIPGGKVDVSPASDPRTLHHESSEMTPACKTDQMASNSGPRTLKDLAEMLTAAKEAQWGETNDDSVAGENLSVIGNFFEDDSLDSNSDSSGNDDDDDDDMNHDAEEMYKQYFGELEMRRNSALSASIEQRQNNLSSGTNPHRSIGPSSEMLQPVVTTNVVTKNATQIFLAKGWKLGGRLGIEKDAHLTTEDVSLYPNRQLRKFDTMLSTRKESITESPSNLRDSTSHSAEQLRFRNSMEDSMTFLKKLFNHQQEGGIMFPAALLSPPDSKILMNERAIAEKSNNKDDSMLCVNVSDSSLIRSEHIGSHKMLAQEIQSVAYHFKEMDDVYQLCLHNARISRECNESEKERVWKLLAEVAMTEMDHDSKICSGWSERGGDALGTDMVSNLFMYYNKLGDFQMLATMFCVLKGSRNDDENIKSRSLLPKSLDEVSDTYIIRYGELLYSWGLLNTRAELNKYLRRHHEKEGSKFPSTDAPEKSSGIEVSISCPTCKHEMNAGTNFCPSCKTFAFRCCVCDIAVRGLFTFCDICKHGGHLSHMFDWFSNNSFCPTGCGCKCNLSHMLHTKTEIANQDHF